jgi:hypothetical protein
MTNKFNAKGAWYNPVTCAQLQIPSRFNATQASFWRSQRTKEGFIYFGSQVELKCYLLLKQCFPDLWIETHNRVNLTPQVTRLSDAITWKIDFCLMRSNVFNSGLPKDIYIEIKGKETAEFRLKRKLLLLNFPGSMYFQADSPTELCAHIQTIQELMENHKSELAAFHNNA